MRKSLMVGLVVIFVLAIGAVSYVAYQQYTALANSKQAHKAETDDLNKEISHLTDKLKKFEYVNEDELYDICRERVVKNDSDRFAANSVAKVEGNVTTYETDPETYRELKKQYEQELADCEKRFKAS